MNRNFEKMMAEVRGRCGKVLVAVSGGIDSMCMAELFAGIGGQVPFAVAHCNFSLRGEESDGDEALVREWAQERGITVHVKRFDTVGYARKKGISIEMAARELRYGWFMELCREHGYDSAAVAHNANDNAETLMLNLLRGAGMNGLSGMSLSSELPVPQGIKEDSERPAPLLLRPLLTFTRKQIEGHVFAHKIPYREDRTNASSEYKRNRIRNEVFPVFETINPSFIRTLNHSMGNFAEAGEIVADYCRNIVPTLVLQEDEASVSVDLAGLMARKHWRYLLYFILEPYGFNSAVLSSIEELLLSSRTISGKTFSSATHKLNMERNQMIVRKAESSEEAESRNREIMPVRGAGTYHFNGRSFKVELTQWTSDMPLKQPEGTIVLDADKLKFPFVLRAWRPGDWFIPLGMRGKKKLSDLFTDLKYTSLQKRSAVMIIDSMTADSAEFQHIAGLACERIDKRYRICPGTERIVRITEISQ